MFIQTEQTPNPQTLKFLPGKVVMDGGTAFFQNNNDTSNSPFAKRLFEVAALLRRMIRYKLLSEDEKKLDFVLGLTLPKLMERRRMKSIKIRYFD